MKNTPLDDISLSGAVVPQGEWRDISTMLDLFFLAVESSRFVGVEEGKEILINAPAEWRAFHLIFPYSVAMTASSRRIIVWNAVYHGRGWFVYKSVDSNSATYSWITRALVHSQSS